MQNNAMEDRKAIRANIYMSMQMKAAKRLTKRRML